MLKVLTFLTLCSIVFSCARSYSKYVIYTNEYVYYVDDYTNVNGTELIHFYYRTSPKDSVEVFLNKPYRIVKQL